ncbi:MAG: DNA alkylation repair protein [Hespellia sp.]|nr:DNA alkylation repair protein [Hespellia sp.]
MNQKIRDDLFTMQDEKYRDFHKNLCPGTDNIIGIRIPLLRDYAKNLAKGDWQDYLENAWNDYNEEIMLQGLVLGYVKTDIETRLSCLADYIPKINNWANCDSPCMSMKFIKKEQSRVLEFLQPYLASDKEYEVRFAVVTLLDYYVDADHIDYVLSTLDGICLDAYYVKMAVAWTLCECYLKFPEKTMQLFHQNHLDDFTFNKAIQKIRESLRVSKEEKEMLNQMKRPVKRRSQR